MGVAVDLAGLQTVAASVDTSAGSVGEAFASVSGALAVTGATGWAAADAARSAAAVWEQFGPQLSSTVSGLAAALRAAADGYATTDEVSAQAIGGWRSE